MSDIDDIQTALHDRLATGTYSPIHHVDGKRITGTELVKPATCLVHLVSSKFSTSGTSCSLSQIRTNIKFSAHLAFHGPTSVENFEEAVAKAPLVVAKADGDSIIMLLSEVAYSEPVEQQPSSGTRVLFSFVSLDL